MAGWIKIHRDIQNHWIAHDMEKFGWWIDLLLLANFEDSKVLVGSTLVEVKRGQMIMSLSFLADRWKVSKRTILKFLQLLESDNMCNRCSNRKVTILTICNYESYQEVEKQEVTDEVTDKYPIGNRLVTETKKNKEEKEIYNNISNAHACTREERIPWDSVREKSFRERFVAQGCGITASRATGKGASEIMRMLDAFMARCELGDIGHKEFSHFNNHFLQFVKNPDNSISNGNDNRTRDTRRAAGVSSAEEINQPF